MNGRSAARTRSPPCLADSSSPRYRIRQVVDRIGSIACFRHSNLNALQCVLQRERTAIGLIQEAPHQVQIASCNRMSEQWPCPNGQAHRFLCLGIQKHLGMLAFCAHTARQITHPHAGSLRKERCCARHFAAKRPCVQSRREFQFQRESRWRMKLLLIFGRIQCTPCNRLGCSRPAAWVISRDCKWGCRRRSLSMRFVRLRSLHWRIRPSGRLPPVLPCE